MVLASSDAAYGCGHPVQHLRFVDGVGFRCPECAWVSPMSSAPDPSPCGHVLVTAHRDHFDCLLCGVVRRPREARSYGRWSQRGLPHKAWSRERRYRIEGDGWMVCDMCQRQEIRNVNVMRHPDADVELHVGNVCAANMSEPYVERRRVFS